MPRRLIDNCGGLVLHVLNRSVRRSPLFTTESDYEAFLQVTREALERVPVRLLAYCLMPNHWHLVLWPTGDEIPRFLHWLTLVHAKRWHAEHGSVSTGHVYQGPYKAIPVQTDAHCLRLIRYVERNALRAGLVERAEDWPWGSLWARCNSREVIPLSAWPISEPPGWATLVNEPHTSGELEQIRGSILHNRPLGDAPWRAAVTKPGFKVVGRDDFETRFRDRRTHT